MSESRSKNSELMDASVGVEALIQKLKREGVESGQAQAKAVVAEAEQRAQWMLDQAKEEAANIVETARQEASVLEQQSKAALSQAVRDVSLAVQRELTQQFEMLVHQKVDVPLNDEALLASLVEQVVLRTIKEHPTSNLRVVLPERIVDLETLKADPEEHQNRPLSQLVKQWAVTLVDHPIQIKTEKISGFRVTISEYGVELNLTGEQIETLLLEHLRPRFRALIEGVIR